MCRHVPSLLRALLIVCGALAGGTFGCVGWTPVSQIVRDVQELPDGHVSIERCTLYRWAGSRSGRTKVENCSWSDGADTFAPTGSGFSPARRNNSSNGANESYELPSSATGSEGCKNTDFCREYGRCQLVGRSCVALTRQDCRASLTCQFYGRCNPHDGACGP